MKYAKKTNGKIIYYTGKRALKEKKKDATRKRRHLVDLLKANNLPTSPYQTYEFMGKKVPGYRNCGKRARWLQIKDNMKEQVILDIGCNIGGVVEECVKRGATGYGVDRNDYCIEVARKVRKGGAYICADIEQYPKGWSEIPKKVNMLFCLSVARHVRAEKLANLLKAIQWDYCVFEGDVEKYKDEETIQDFIDEHKIKCDSIFIGMSKEKDSRPLMVLMK